MDAQKDKDLEILIDEMELADGKVSFLLESLSDSLIVKIWEESEELGFLGDLPENSVTAQIAKAIYGDSFRYYMSGIVNRIFRHIAYKSCISKLKDA